ncbi:response regulator transcription factor [Amphritea sp. 1_MG-2023]|uniref:response regulator transcription factor n=1 Tax=Amphritea sp. 1_MG-2023 TaxID=3062670 RepID=UPI0026E444BD|nr:response regulator transcription factor [Amphritea sp. 1_MG-2023]MDO6564303.1 response regulator transcription factor [Amphritea sp. 1_MG-2023]
MANEKIRVVLVDDHALVQEGIIARLENEPSMDVVGAANNGAEALQLIAKLKPDVVLMDISMPVMNGFEATERLRAEQPDVRVLILSMHESREYILKLIQCGASGYVLKDVSASELVNAIKTVDSGATYFSAGVSQSLFSQPELQPQAEVNAASASEPLTGREIEVLRLLANGASNKAVARELDISVRTAETHRQNIKNKLDIHSAAGLVRYAIEHKLID